MKVTTKFLNALFGLLIYLLAPIVAVGIVMWRKVRR